MGFWALKAFLCLGEAQRCFHIVAKNYVIPEYGWGAATDAENQRAERGKEEGGARIKIMRRLLFVLNIVFFKKTFAAPPEII